MDPENTPIGLRPAIDRAYDKHSAIASAANDLYYAILEAVAHDKMVLPKKVNAALRSLRTAMKN